MLIEVGGQTLKKLNDMKLEKTITIGASWRISVPYTPIFSKKFVALPLLLGTTLVNFSERNLQKSGTVLELPK